MPGIASISVRWSVLVASILVIAGCSSDSSNPPPVEIELYQQWQLQPGDTIAGRTITGGLGDISIDLDGKSIYAPFDGKVQPTKADCVLFSSPEVPGYLFRMCGLSSHNLGDLRQGEEIGTGDHLEFAALRKQADGKWAIVEPSKSILESTLQKP